MVHFTHHALHALDALSLHSEPLFHLGLNGMHCPSKDGKLWRASGPRSKSHATTSTFSYHTQPSSTSFRALLSQSIPALLLYLYPSASTSLASNRSPLPNPSHFHPPPNPLPCHPNFPSLSHFPPPLFPLVHNPSTSNLVLFVPSPIFFSITALFS